MKTKIKPLLTLTITFLALALNTPGVRAQGTPPVVATNIITLTPSTTLAWAPNPEPDLAGYYVELHRDTNVWRHFTTNTAVQLLTITTNLLPNGPYEFAVQAVNTAGQLSPFATLSTNLSKPPGLVLFLRLELTFTP